MRTSKEIKAEIDRLQREYESARRQEEPQEKLRRTKDRLMQEFLSQKQFEKVDSDQITVWNIHGEDPNPDMGGPHSNPLLATVKGTYEEAVDYALTLDGFFQWGYGGHLSLPPQGMVVDLSTMKKNKGKKP